MAGQTEKVSQKIRLKARPLSQPSRKTLLHKKCKHVTLASIRTHYLAVELRIKIFKFKQKPSKLHCKRLRETNSNLEILPNLSFKRMRKEKLKNTVSVI